MSEHGERPAGAIHRVGPGEKARIADDGPGEADTEGHLRPNRVGPGEHLIEGSGTVADPGLARDPSPASDGAE